MAFKKQAGLSLLEMVVAMAVLGIALGGLYKAASGATRNIRADERYAYGVELGRSLIANYSQIPATGLQEEGETEGGFRWEVSAVPVDFGRSGLTPGSLQAMEVTVAWSDGSKDRRIQLHTIVEGVASEEGF